MFCSDDNSNLLAAKPLYSRLVFEKYIFFEERTLELSLLGGLLTFFQWDLSLSLDILLVFFLSQWKVFLQSLPLFKKNVVFVRVKKKNGEEK